VRVGSCEVIDKGCINQRAVLAQRDALMQALRKGSATDPFVTLPNDLTL
jgi:hypothetical protein